MLPVKPRALRMPCLLILLLPVCFFLLSFIFPPKPHLIFIGWDGVPPELINYLTSKGTLPNTTFLLERGALDKLVTHKFTQTRLIWPIIYSGYSPEHNGITIDLASNYEGVKITPEMRTAPALWEDVASGGEWAMVVIPYESSPAERDNHVMEVSDGIMLVEDLEQATADDFSSSAVQDWSLTRIKWGEYDPWVSHELDFVLSPTGFNAVFGPKAEDGSESAQEIIKRLTIKLRREMLGITALMQNSVLLGNQLTLVYFEGTDIFQHMYNTRVPLSEPIIGNNKIKTEMRIYDAALGKIMDAAPPGSYFCIVSDHGFDMEPNDHATFQIKQLGAKNTIGETVLKAETATINGKKLYSKIDESESSITVTLNHELSKKEKQSALNFLRQEPNLFPVGLGLAEDHSSSINPDSSMKYFEDAVPPVGIFLLSGPGIEKDRSMDLITIYDITPTLLYALGLEVASDMDGSPKLSLFNSGWVGKHQVKMVDHLPPRKTAQTKALQDNSERLLELQGLGYTDSK
jgi:predicted AlkP superfamily phosphohydrolase/phosphomutase